MAHPNQYNPAPYGVDQLVGTHPDEWREVEEYLGFDRAVKEALHFSRQDRGTYRVITCCDRVPQVAALIQAGKIVELAFDKYPDHLLEVYAYATLSSTHHLFLCDMTRLDWEYQYHVWAMALIAMEALT